MIRAVVFTARAIERGLLAREPAAEVAIVDAVDVLDRAVRTVAEETSSTASSRGGRRCGRSRRRRSPASPAQLLQEVERRSPDVVVSARTRRSTRLPHAADLIQELAK